MFDHVVLLSQTVENENGDESTNEMFDRNRIGVGLYTKGVPKVVVQFYKVVLKHICSLIGFQTRFTSIGREQTTYEKLRSGLYRYPFFACVMTELYDAAEEGNLERVKLLVEQGVDKNQVDGFSGTITPLLGAAGKGHFSVVRYLVEQGADMEKADIGGVTPLISVSSFGHLEIARYLLEQGVNRDKADYEGCFLRLS